MELQWGQMLSTFRLNAKFSAFSMKEFLAAFSTLAQQVEDACGSSLIWKDADPQRWLEISPRISQHQHPYCQAIKSDPTRRLRCCHADNAPPAAGTMEWRVCPFGVVEWVVPGRREGVLLGWVFVGTWFRAIADPPVTTVPPEPQTPRAAKARAALVVRLLSGILGLHPGAMASKDPRLRKARAYMEEHLDIHLPAAACARHLGLSTSRFVHWFAEAAGQSWSKELSSRVMARAADRLRTRGETVTHIALDLGFGSPAGFTAAFSRHHGLPPAHWRRKFAAAGE